MTLYRNLGPITFQCQTQSFQIFSSQNSNLILQFKNYQDINLDQINQILKVYHLILKQPQLLEIYSQKNKPSSIILHKGIRIDFQKINIQLLCRIIKQMITSIIHTQKIICGKIGQINKQMFFQIDGELRYLYFPTIKYGQKSDSLISNVLSFFSQLKDQKEVSHRILLKKITKCQSLQEILEQTEYFLSIYHAKQINSSYANLSVNNSQEQFFNKTLTKTKTFGKTSNDNFHMEFRNSTPLGFNPDGSSVRNSTRRKYNLFKNTDMNLLKNNPVPQYNNFSSSTLRKPQKQNAYLNPTFRVNSRAVHIDMNQKPLKNTSNSLFNRASSVTSNSKKFSQSKKKSGIFSLHKNNQSHQYRNQDYSRTQNFQRNSRIRNNSSKLSQSQQINNFNVSKMSQQAQQMYQHQRNMRESQCLKNSQSSQRMKQMVQNSLQKWKNKSNQKISIFSRIKQKDREGSTQVDSRSKFLQKYDRPSYDILKQSKISAASHMKNSSKVQQNTPANISANISQPFNRQLTASEKHFKSMIPINRSVVIDSYKKQYPYQQTNNAFQFIAIQQPHTKTHANNSNNNNNQPQSQNSRRPQTTKPNQPHHQTHQQPHHHPKQQPQSLQQINLCKSSIQNLAIKNKFQQQQLRLKNQNKQRLQTSIKEININENKYHNNQKILSDESQTERIKYDKHSSMISRNQSIRNTLTNGNNNNNNYTDMNDEADSKIQKHNTVKNSKNYKQTFQKELQYFTQQLEQIYFQKDQIDFIGVAVAQTTNHLKNFQSIYWQLPLFFLYKKFYQKRIQLAENIKRLLEAVKEIKSKAQKYQVNIFGNIQTSTNTFLNGIQKQNINIQDGLKKLMKTAKKKLKKQYPIKQQSQYIQTFINLNYQKNFDQTVDKFITMYLMSLLQGRQQYPQLTQHIIQIIEGILVYKGIKIDSSEQKRPKNNLTNSNNCNNQKTQKYFNQLINKKEIRNMISNHSYQSQTEIQESSKNSGGNNNNKASNKKKSKK